MKTTDLIPIILYQLADGDKYGYEIVKQIEDLSSGSIVIKQPTLYSILKKLEQGRFISSYWQDSEIGGKRHYYKLTDNGKAQLDTYPTIDKLIKEAVGEEDMVLSVKSENKPVLVDEKQDEVVKVDNEIVIDTKPTTEYNDIVITPSPIDITIPITNINDEDNINNLNDNDISTVNLDIEVVTEKEPTSSYSSIFDAIEYEPTTISTIKEEKTIESEENNTIVESENAPKFTEKVEELSSVDNNRNKLYEQLSPSEDLVVIDSEKIDKDLLDNTNNFIEEVKYLNYVDFTTDKYSLRRKKTIKNRIQKMCLTCVTLLLTIVFSIFMCNKYSYTRIYAIAILIVSLIVILYPIILLSNVHKLKLKYCSYSFKYSLSHDFFIKFSLFLSLVIAIFAYNLTISTNVSNIFAIDNFANFICPIIFSSVILLDFVYSALLYKKYAKK